MITFVDRLPLSVVETGAAGEDAQFLLSIWRRNEGLVQPDRGMVHLSRKLMLFKPDYIPDDVPPATLIGADSTFRRYLPPVDRPAALPEAYRRQVAPGYHAAIHGEPWFDVQRTGTMMGAGTPDLTLERLLLPFRTATGLVRLFVLLRLVEEHARSGRSDREGRRGSCLPDTGRCRWEQVHRPPSAPHSHAVC